jgi:predicted secreted hydrolase
LHFPRDHFAHPTAGIEWWYFTGVAKGSDGHRYSLFFTLFSRGGYVIPISQVVDLDTGTVVGHTETLAKTKVVASRLNVSVPGASLRYQRAGNKWRVGVSQAAYAVTFAAVPQKRYVLHGNGTGVIQTPTGPSDYYSATRMSTRGTLRTGAGSISFTGTMWFDHEWGNFGADPRALNWDWFSCRFDDDTELMLYRFRDADGTALPPSNNVTYVLRSGRAKSATTPFVDPGDRVLDTAGHEWPLDWKLMIPSLGIAERVLAIVPDQLFRGTLVPTFYEGAASASGSKSGTCFVEETYGAG